jgi:hypothetical protein
MRNLLKAGKSRKTMRKALISKAADFGNVSHRGERCKASFRGTLGK